MNEREYLAKAQEAEALADAAETPLQRHTWENIAKEYRRLARVALALRQEPSKSSEV